MIAANTCRTEPRQVHYHVSQKMMIPKFGKLGMPTNQAHQRGRGAQNCCEDGARYAPCPALSASCTPRPRGVRMDGAATSPTRANLSECEKAVLSSDTPDNTAASRPCGGCRAGEDAHKTVGDSAQARPFAANGTGPDESDGLAASAGVGRHHDLGR